MGPPGFDQMEGTYFADLLPLRTRGVRRQRLLVLVVVGVLLGLLEPVDEGLGRLAHLLALFLQALFFLKNLQISYHALICNDFLRLLWWK